jgi:hypothetical protein
LLTLRSPLDGLPAGGRDGADIGVSESSSHPALLAMEPRGAVTIANRHPRHVVRCLTPRTAEAVAMENITPPAAGYALHYGNAQATMVRVVPDDQWPRMWRMIWPDGQLSDMANLSRIRDAAAVICERGPPARNRRSFHWKIEPVETLPRGTVGAIDGEGAPIHTPAQQNERGSAPPRAATGRG